jgi:tetratricopeptide (TPR) repeat protein
MSTRVELGALEASGLIQVAALQPELEYLFRHALVQEAAYSSLLKQDRRELHRAAAETIIALHPDRERELAGVIGMHFEQAGDAARAAQYLVVAGEHALERFASKEGVGFFTRAFALVDDTQTDLRLRAAVGAAKAGWTFSTPGEDMERLESAVAAAGGSDSDRRLIAEALFWNAFLRRQRGETPASSPELKALLDRAGDIGESLNDPGAIALPKALMGAFAAFTGHLREGAADMREALDALERRGDPLSTAMVSDFLAMTYARLGEFSAADETVAHAQELAGDGDAISRVDVDISRSAIHLERGDLDLASTQAEQCAIRAETLGAYACVVASSFMHGAARLARDDAPAARAPLERGEELSMVTNMAPMRTLIQGFLGSVWAQLGDVPRGMAGWDEALANARRMNDRYGEAQTLWARARTRMRQSPSELSEAIADLDRAIDLFEGMEARPSLARALHDRADVLSALGRADEGAIDYRRSSELARELGLKDVALA